MEYLRHLLGRAWNETWNVVFNSPLVTVLLALAIFALSTLIHWHRKGFSDVRDALIVAGEGAMATIIVFILVFALHVFFLTPKRINEELLTQIHPKADEPCIKLDVTDVESRKQISDLQAKLETANDTIRKLQSSLASAKRSLKPEQRSLLVTALKQYGSFELGVRNAGTQEAQDYADQLKAALIEGGWKIRETQFLIANHQPLGLWVMVPNGKEPTKGANELLSALTAAGLNGKGIEVTALHEGTFDLIVGFPTDEPIMVQSTLPSPTPDKEASPH
jgi:hypothetical protein